MPRLLIAVDGSDLSKHAIGAAARLDPVEQRVVHLAPVPVLLVE